MYSHLVFTGGGLSGISYLGVIRYMQEIGLHKHIHEVAGTSIGAFFACIFAINISAGELEDYIKEFFKDETNISFTLLNSLVSFLDTFGLDDGARLVKPIRYFIEKKYNWTKDTISFREFVKKTGVNIIICATNVHTRKCVYFNIDTTPDVCIYDALRASMTIPLFMKPVIIQNEMYVDGGLSDDLPIRGFKNIKLNSLLIVGAGNIIRNDIMPNNIMNYICILFQILINNNKLSKELLQTKTNVYKYLLLDESPISFLHIEPKDDGILQVIISEKDIDEAIAYGYTKMYEFLLDK